MPGHDSFPKMVSLVRPAPATWQDKSGLLLLGVVTYPVVCHLFMLLMFGMLCHAVERAFTVMLWHACINVAQTQSIPQKHACPGPWAAAGHAHTMVAKAGCPHQI